MKWKKRTDEPKEISKDDILRRRMSIASSRNKEDSDDIGQLWAEQSRKEEQREKLLKAYEANKSKSRQLRKEIIKEYTDPSEIEGKLVSVFERMKTTSGDLLTKLRRFRYKKTALTVLGFVLVLVVIGNPSTKPETLGESTETNTPAEVSSYELPRERPGFEILYPANTDESSLDIVRISPDGSAPAYAFLDSFTAGSPIQFRVTQQQTPQGFDLESVATGFQATDVIQVDAAKIFHGYSEKGKTQSLFFEKNGLLVSVRSPEKYTDEQWAAYYLSLK